MKKYKHALVIGKFMNPHVGHGALIEYAISLADKVTVLVCATPHDRMDPEVRKKWLSETFTEPYIHFDILNYLDEGLEGGEESDVDISAAWSNWILSRRGLRYGLQGMEALVGSEDYINYMAEASKGAFTAEIYNQERSIHNCSSTGVHNGDFDFYLPACKRDLLVDPNYGRLL